MLKHYVLAYAALLISTTLSAQHWTGAVDSDWNNPANWSDWPLGGEDVTINPSQYAGAQASPVLTANSVFIPDRLFAENGAQVQLQGGLTVDDRFIVSDDAEVNMTSGTLITDRLILEAGGRFDLTAGTVTALGVLALGDDGTLPSLFTQHGGTVNVSGEFGFDVELQPSTPVYHLLDGDLTVNGDAVWFGASPGGGQGRFLIDGGSAQINGSMMNTAGSTVDLFLRITGGDLVLNGPILDMAHATDSLEQSSGTWVLDNTLVVECDGVIRCTGGDQQVAGQVELRGSGTIRWHDVETDTQSSLEHTGPDELQVGGNWLRAGTFDPDNNTVAFVGTTDQQIIGTGFHGLRIANSGPGVTLAAGTASVAGELVLDNGLVHTSDIALIEILHNATATAGSPASHVDGPMRKIGNGDFVFPIGKNGTWRRIAISGLNDQDTEFTAEYLDAGYGNTTSLEPGLVSVSATEHWRLERAVTTDDASVQLFWEDAAASGITDCATLAVAHWNGSSWSGAASGTTGSCTGSDAGTVQSTGSVPNYAAFTFGTSDGTLGVGDATRASALHPYPQPANDRTWVPVPRGTTTLTLFDLTGQRIARVGVSASTDTGTYLDTRALATGIYVVQAAGPSSVLATGRLVVAH